MSTIKSDKDNNKNEELHEPFGSTDNIGDKIKKLRQSLKLTGKELADKIGVSKVAISQYENNKAKPTLENLKKIADVGNVDLDYFSDAPTKILSTDEEITEFLDKESVKAMRATFTTMGAICKHAKRKRLISNLIDYDDIEIKKKPFSHTEIAKRQGKFLDAVELKDALYQLSKEDSRISLLFEFISLTGLRIGELLALRYCDYDKENATININGTIQYDYKNSSEVKRGTPKNIYSVRDVSLSDRAVSILDSIMLENKRRSLWFEGYIDHGYIFTASRGNPYDIQFLNRKLKAVQIEGKHLTTHIFRHTHISMLAELGVPLKSIMQRVGHNDPNTTLSIYTHVTKSMQDDVIEKLNQRKA